MGTPEEVSMRTATAATRLLVVDDESNVASVIARMLRRKDYEVT